MDKAILGVILLMTIIGYAFMFNTHKRVEVIDDYIGNLNKNFFLSKEYQNMVSTYNEAVIAYNKQLSKDAKRQLQQ